VSLKSGKGLNNLKKKTKKRSKRKSSPLSTLSSLSLPFRHRDRLWKTIPNSICILLLLYTKTIVRKTWRLVIIMRFFRSIPNATGLLSPRRPLPLLLEFFRQRKERRVLGRSPTQGTTLANFGSRFLWRTLPTEKGIFPHILFLCGVSWAKMGISIWDRLLWRES